MADPTRDDMQTLRALAQAATPGPWVACADYPKGRKDKEQQR